MYIGGEGKVLIIGYLFFVLEMWVVVFGLVICFGGVVYQIGFVWVVQMVDVEGDWIFVCFMCQFVYEVFMGKGIGQG